jgi:hypothetical protein
MLKKRKDKLEPLSFGEPAAAPPEPYAVADETLFVEAAEATPASAGAPPSEPDTPAGEAAAAVPKSPVRTQTVAPADRRAQALPAWARAAYWIAVPAALLWAGAMAAFAAGYQNPFGPFEYRPYPMVAFAGLCLLPTLFILLAAYAVRQAAKLSIEMRLARALAADLAIPAALAADQTGGAAVSVRREVERATAAAADAERQLLALRSALAEESDRLIDAAADAGRRAEALRQGLSHERTELGVLAETLDAQTQTVSGVIAAGSRMVAEASDLAAAQLQEAEAALTAKATDLAAAAGEAGEAAQMVSDALDGHIDKLDHAGAEAATRMTDLQDAFFGQQTRLWALADQLRVDQEHIATRLAEERETLMVASADARAGAEEVAEASRQSAASLRGLIAAVAEEVGQIAATAEADQDALSARAAETMTRFTGAVAEERSRMEVEARAALDAMAAAAADTRQAAMDQTEAAKARVEALGQAALLAGQTADQVFDTRIKAARGLIDQSTQMLDQAGQRSIERIETGLAATRTAVEDLQALLAAVDAKVAALPDETRARAQTVRDAVERSIGELTAAAHKAAEETQAIDAVFQSRIKHNYDMLSEALRLMSKVADVAGGAGKTPSRPQTPTSSPPKPAPVMAETAAAIRLPPLASVAASDPANGRSSDDQGLRPRLKLTSPPASALAAVVSATPAEARAAPAPPRPAQTASPAAAGEWTWKDLLSSIDEPPMDDEVLAERLIMEIENLGLDAPSLLPLHRIDEIATVLQAGDVDGARDVVRNLAPSAVRRLSRRVLTDKVLHAHADRYLQRYETLLAESAKRDLDGFVTAALLGSDPGRAFLLFNAAVGELH